MPTITDAAICIRSWDFSETSQTVSLFTRGHGVIRGLAKGSRRERGNFSGGLDILTRGQIVAIVKPGRDLATLTHWHLEESYPGPRTRLAANRAAIYMADLVHHMITDHDPHPGLFDALDCALRGLEDEEQGAGIANPGNVDGILLRFQWTLLEETGYKPVLDSDARTGESLLPSPSRTLAFSPRAGGVVSEASAGDEPIVWRVRPQTIEALRAAAHPNQPNQLITADAETLKRANRLLASYLRELIGSEPPAMRWAFA